MPVIVQGGPELAARLDNMKDVFRLVAVDWQDETIRLARTRVRHRTGKALSSLRPTRVTKKGDASVRAIWYAKFEEAGAKAHDIVAKGFSARNPRYQKRIPIVHGGDTIYARRVHRRAQVGDHFLGRSATDAIESTRIADSMEKAWG